MLHETQRTSAPSAFKVSISTAVWIVMCSEPAMRAPLSGLLAPNSSRVAIRPGISVSAREISLRPKSARPMSFTMYSDAGAVMTVPEVKWMRRGGTRRRPGPFVRVAIAKADRGGKKDIKISLYRFQDLERADPVPALGQRYPNKTNG